jgi:hypothetical protein
MQGHIECEICDERFAERAKASQHARSRGHQVRAPTPDELDQPPISEPPTDYRTETTEDCHGDIETASTSQTDNLTEQLASTVTRAGGRIPIDLEPDSTSKPQQREREWVVYAPAPNPYHVVADITDLLIEADEIARFNVNIDRTVPISLADRIRATRVFDAFETGEDQKMEQYFRHLRWNSGVDSDQEGEESMHAATDIAPDVLVTQVEQAIQDRAGRTDLLEQLDTTPGDAWEYQPIHITVTST